MDTRGEDGVANRGMLASDGFLNTSERRMTERTAEAATPESPVPESRERDPAEDPGSKGIMEHRGRDRRQGDTGGGNGGRRLDLPSQSDRQYVVAYFVWYG